MEREYPFYHFSSFHGEPDKAEGLPLRFVSATSGSLFDEKFASGISTRHFPEMDDVFLTPTEEFKATIYYPGFLNGRIEFEGVGDMEPGDSFTFEDYLKVSLRQKGEFSEGLEGVPFPVVWVFEGSTETMVRVSIGSYFPRMADEPKTEGAERVERRDRFWDVPLYSFFHPASLNYYKPFMWQWFDREDATRFNLHVPQGIWDMVDEKYYCQGIFYPMEGLRNAEKRVRVSNFTGEGVQFSWHGPKNAGFGEDKKKSFHLAPFETVSLGSTTPRKEPQVVVAAGKYRVEWFPLYFYEPSKE